MSRACSTNGEKRNARRILLVKQEERIPLGRSRRRWEANIKMGLRYDGVVCIGLIWIRVGISGDLLCTQERTLRFHKIND
jgi:hypothetical protein